MCKTFFPLTLNTLLVVLAKTASLATTRPQRTQTRHTRSTLKVVSSKGRDSMKVSTDQCPEQQHRTPALSHP